MPSSICSCRRPPTRGRSRRPPTTTTCRRAATTATPRRSERTSTTPRIGRADAPPATWSTSRTAPTRAVTRPSRRTARSIPPSTRSPRPFRWSSAPHATSRVDGSACCTAASARRLQECAAQPRAVGRVRLRPHRGLLHPRRGHDQQRRRDAAGRALPGGHGLRRLSRRHRCARRRAHLQHVEGSGRPALRGLPRDGAGGQAPGRRRRVPDDGAPAPAEAAPAQGRQGRAHHEDRQEGAGGAAARRAARRGWCGRTRHACRDGRRGRLVAHRRRRLRPCTAATSSSASAVT